MKANYTQKVKEYVIATNKELSDNQCYIHPHNGCCIYCRGVEEKTYCDEAYKGNQRKINTKTAFLVSLLKLYRKLSFKNKKLLEHCITYHLASDLSNIDKIKLQ